MCLLFCSVAYCRRIGHLTTTLLRHIKGLMGVKKVDMSKKIDAKTLFETVKESLGPYALSPLILEFIRFTLKNRYEGVILVDPEGRIAFMDKPSEKFFGLPWGGAKGKHISELVPGTNLHKVARTGVPEIGQVQEVKGYKKIVTRLPIIRNGEVIGAVGKVMFHDLQEIEKLRNKVRRLQSQIEQFRKSLELNLSAQYTFDNIIGISAKIEKAKKIAMRAAVTDENILLIGESGTGKELFAHAIHNFSLRAKGPFVKVNCAAIPFELAESELFGYEKGAFTGARIGGKKGKFKLAEGGTLFLDEVGSLPLSLQAKLLRVLQDKEIQPLGSNHSERIDFRLVAATNAKLDDLVQRGAFRGDLYYRLNVIPIEIPPLRERKEDIVFLAEKFLENINERMKTNVIGFSTEVIESLLKYHWPGNVRELINVIEQAVLNAHPKKIIELENLPTNILGTNESLADIQSNSLKKVISMTEKQAIENALKISKGNKARAAKLLGIHRASLYIKLKKYNIT